jgi:hypothetical protein
MEAKALIKEAYSSGDESMYHETKWYKHDGTYIGKSFVYDTEFEIVVEDTDSLDGYKSVIVEVY